MQTIVLTLLKQVSINNNIKVAQYFLLFKRVFMKKKLLLILTICICFIFTGCSYGEVGLVQNADGSVIEYYYIPLPEATLIQNGLNSAQVNTLIANVRADYEGNNGIFTQLINDYQKRVYNSNYSLDKKTELIKGVTYKVKLISDENNFCSGMRYSINFTSSDCYLEFKEANSYIKEDKEVTQINKFFTTVTKVTKDPLFDKISNGAITLGQSCVNQVQKHLINIVGESNWEEFKYNIEFEKYSSRFNYTYVVPTKRIHTNATSITQQNGYYYHTWTVNLNNLTQNQDSIIKIEYYTVSANKAVWYVIAMLIAGIVIASVYIAGRKKEQQTLQKTNDVEIKWKYQQKDNMQ